MLILLLWILIINDSVTFFYSIFFICLLFAYWTNRLAYERFNHYLPFAGINCFKFGPLSKSFPTGSSSIFPSIYCYKVKCTFFFFHFHMTNKIEIYRNICIEWIKKNELFDFEYLNVLMQLRPTKFHDMYSYKNLTMFIQWIRIRQPIRSGNNTCSSCSFRSLQRHV